MYAAACRDSNCVPQLPHSFSRTIRQLFPHVCVTRHTEKKTRRSLRLVKGLRLLSEDSHASASDRNEHSILQILEQLPSDFMCTKSNENEAELYTLTQYLSNGNPIVKKLIITKTTWKLYISGQMVDLGKLGLSAKFDSTFVDFPQDTSQCKSNKTPMDCISQSHEHLFLLWNHKVTISGGRWEHVRNARQIYKMQEID